MDGEIVLGHCFEGPEEAVGESGFTAAQVEVLAGDVPVVVEGIVEDIVWQGEFRRTHFFYYNPEGYNNLNFRIMSLADKRKVPSKEKKRRQPTLTEEQLVEIKEAFDLFDSEKTETIKYHELKILLKALGFEVSKSMISELASEYDKNDRGLLTYSAYV